MEQTNNKNIGIFMWYNDPIKDYADINNKINQIYCEKYGYHLIVSNDRLYPSRKPHWERIPLLLNNFDNFDYLIWIDADAHFFIDSPPITNLIDEFPEKTFIFSEDFYDHKNKFLNQINSGVFIVKSCSIGKNFLKEWGYNEELFQLYNGYLGWNDQAILVNMYDKNINNIVENSIIIKYGILQTLTENFIIPKKMFGLTTNPFIFHMAGQGDRYLKSYEYYSNIQMNKYKSFINDKIQLADNVIKDILLNGENKKILVFGLGYDSELWYNLTNKNTFFVENNIHYIDLNKNIQNNNIIYHQYDKINVRMSLNLSDKEINEYKIPKELLENAPFDIIIIDGPTGYDDTCPGRLLPIFWSKKYLSKKSTIIYIDDASRKLEKKCINKYFIDYPKNYFRDRLGTIKIII